MAAPIQIRMGGYGPPTTGFSKSMKFIGDRLEKQFGDRIDVKYCWNIMDFGYKAEEILWLVESGILTLGYQSSSYLTDRVPELSFVDLPFLFANNDKARRDGRRARPPLVRRSRARQTSASSAGTRTASATSPTASAPSACRPTSRASPSACCRARSRNGPSSCSAPSR
jgi:TRAP-type C4-dicarboxylate transport system substrate-binding protein